LETSSYTSVGPCLLFNRSANIISVDKKRTTRTKCNDLFQRPIRVCAARRIHFSNTDDGLWEGCSCLYFSNTKDSRGIIRIFYCVRKRQEQLPTGPQATFPSFFTIFLHTLLKDQGFNLEKEMCVRKWRNSEWKDAWAHWRELVEELVVVCICLANLKINRFLSPGRYQQLDLFIKVLRLLCPNLTDASRQRKRSL
jgi:hypothetical protein